MTTRITPGVGANLLGQHSAERNQDATAYVGCLDPQVTEELLWELFVQAGPVANVYVPKDRVSNLHQGYGFVEFRSEEDADYAIKILNMIKLYGKPIRVNKASQDKKSADVGANLFIGNLDPDVDDKLLHDTFSAFGPILGNPKIMRDPETGNSKGFGFISYDSFEASDAAIEAMAGQYLQNRPITVSYAYKKDTKGERHGTQAERMLAASNPSAQKSRPNTMFASGPPTLVGPPVLAQPNGSMGLMMNGGMAHHHQQHHHVYNAVQMMPPPPQVQIAQYGMPPHPHMHHHHLPPHPQMIWRAPPPPPPPQPMQPPPLQLQQHLQLQQQQQQQQLSAAAPPPPPPQYHRPPPPAARPPPPPPPPIPSAPAAPTITTTTAAAAAAAAPPSPPPPPPPVSSSSSSPPPSPSSSAPPPSSPPPPPVSAAASSSPSACASPPS